MLKYLVFVNDGVLGIKYDSWSGAMTIGGSGKMAENVKIVCREYFLLKKCEQKKTGSRARYCVRGTVPELTFEKGIERLRGDFEVMQVERLERVLS